MRRTRRARGTIEDDDLPTVGFSEDSIFIVEERGEIEFKVKLSAPSTVPIAVDWETEADSAEADVDYTEASGTLTFAPGDTERPSPSTSSTTRLSNSWKHSRCV